MKKHLLFVLISVLLAAPAYAAHPLITDDAGTQGKGHFQVEVSGQAGYDRDKASGTSVKTASPAVTVTYGVVDTVDVIVGTSYQWIRESEQGAVSKENGINDIALAVKWRFFEQDGLSFAIKPGVTFPSGDYNNGLGNGRVTGSLYLIATKELKPFAFHINAGYIRNENRLDQEVNLWHASFAAEYEVMKNLRLVGNIGAQRNMEKGENAPPFFLIGGIIYSLTEKIDLDLGYKYGLSNPEVDHTVLAGVTIKF